ncbi:hypothetical protein AGOR_G00182370 [Albula goreensis]|uniref:Uncharacterized protein n=1 Tax=Albula goreensis TaxID=1534307 RepID=A0A8T3CWR5_9TELE|nr:hypothetical protein AGOR_G00182370 [Albula goreensis]
MKPALPLGLFLVSCVFGAPVPFESEVSQTSTAVKYHNPRISTESSGTFLMPEPNGQNDTENNFTVSDQDSQLQTNSTYVDVFTQPLEPEQLNATEEMLYMMPDSQLQLNDSGNNDTIQLPLPYEHILTQDAMKENITAPMALPVIRLLAPPGPCPLPTCVLTQLGSTLQYGDEKAGVLTRDPFGIGKR